MDVEENADKITAKSLELQATEFSAYIWYLSQEVFDLP